MINTDEVARLVNIWVLYIALLRVAVVHVFVNVKDFDVQEI